MFYCEECAKRNDWPHDFCWQQVSFGRCEICGRTDSCFDVPSRLLPEPKQKGGET